MKRAVTVWGRACEVEVEQRLKTVWFATGDYHGEIIEAKDRTAGAALKRWQTAACTKGG